MYTFLSVLIYYIIYITIFRQIHYPKIKLFTVTYLYLRFIIKIE